MIQYDDVTGECDEYKAFIEKFRNAAKGKKTTDDCCTPANIMRFITEWAVDKYCLHGRKVVRPFFPGGDYENFDYPEGCVVIDNPPFSILSKICRFYDEHKIDYFLFAPTLTLFNANSGKSNYVVCDLRIIYENGAFVNTSFVTNLGDYKILSTRELINTIKKLNEENVGKTNTVSKIKYPPCVISAANIRGIDIRIPAEECVFVRKLDAMHGKKGIYGSGFIISERVAAERVAEERAAEERAAAEQCEVYELSEREKSIQTMLGKSEVVI